MLNQQHPMLVTNNAELFLTVVGNSVQMLFTTWRTAESCK